MRKSSTRQAGKPPSPISGSCPSPSREIHAVTIGYPFAGWGRVGCCPRRRRFYEKTVEIDSGHAGPAHRDDDGRYGIRLGSLARFRRLQLRISRLLGGALLRAIPLLLPRPGVLPGRRRTGCAARLCRAQRARRAATRHVVLLRAEPRLLPLRDAMSRRLEGSAASASSRAMKKKLIFGGTALLLLAACASVPTGPSVMVLPGSNKSFDQFRFDDYECRQYASEYSGGKTAEQASADAGIRSAAAGAAIGALAGAAIGGSGNSAAAGAGLGAAGGAIAGTGAGAQSAHSVQGRYDIGYQQCMYAKGHQIPMAASRYDRPYRPSRPMAPPPPPPPGTPPPPPPQG